MGRRNKINLFLAVFILIMITFAIILLMKIAVKNEVQENVVHENINYEVGKQEDVVHESIKYPVLYSEDDTKYYFKASDKSLKFYNGKSFESIYIKGVNMGLGKPGYFPGEAAITEEEYARWFELIGEMNSNCIRVYTVQPPGFYEALYNYNQTAESPLYLIQGTWYDETRLYETEDAFDSQLLDYLYKDMSNLVDIIHGDCVIEPEAGRASGTYTYDISKYVIGWILGIESDALFVTTTNEAHPDIVSYEGKYISADNVEPFEVFWAQTGDYIVSYEMDKYGMQRPVSFTNWLTADMLTHPSETMDKEDSVDLNVENLTATAAFPSGLFANYHIYPYYPNFMYTQKEYIEYKDEDGNINTYKAYLEDLIAQHDLPVLVSEFGVPAAKGISHANIYTGFNQGNITQQQQGEMLASMMQDIYDTGYAGGMVFSWQDEWFKRIWSTENSTDSDRRAYWDDEMTCEQHYGLLEFVPGEDESKIVVLDGDDSEWSEGDLLKQSNQTSLYVRYDCAYLYLMVKKNNADYSSNPTLISFDITPKSGSMSYNGTNFDRAVDFVVTIDGKDNSQILVQSYYDRYRYEYGEYDEDIPVTDEMQSADNSLFQPIYMFMERELILPDRDEVIPLNRFEIGKLVFGTTDYNSPDYNSLSDYYYDGDILEIRIPWLMLNFRDPSTKEIDDDFWENGFKGLNIDSIWIGISTGDDSYIEMNEFQWENWDYYPYFERPRKSYYILQELYGKLS
jgi:hypothetical protein